MKIVIAGVGKIGYNLAEQLYKNNNVTVIDKDAKIIDNIINIFDVIGFCGSASDYKIQVEAGVGSADLLIASTDSDETNILACLIGKKLGVAHTIARIRDPQNEDMLHFMYKELGLSMAINPEKAAAREISRVLRFPDAVKVETFCGGKLELVQYKIPEGSILDGVKLCNIYSITHTRILICAVTNSIETIIPSGNHILKAGDTIFLSATPYNLSKFFIQLGTFRKKASSVILVGASKICHYLAQEIVSMGMSVKIIDADEEKCIEICEKIPGITAIVGDGNDMDLLIEEGIGITDAFVAVTDSDEANILMSLSVADMFKHCKVVAKLKRKETISFVTRTELIDSIISAGTVTSEIILQYVRAMQNASSGNIRSLHHLADGKTEALEFNVPEDANSVGKKLSELNFKAGILLAGIARKNGQILIPSGDDAIMANDRIIVVTTLSDINDIRDIFN